MSREHSENKRMNDDVVQGLQLVSEYQDSQLGSEDAMFCPLEATESWSDVSICSKLTDIQQEETIMSTIRIQRCILGFTRPHGHRRVHY